MPGGARGAERDVGGRPLRVAEAGQGGQRGELLERYRSLPPSYQAGWYFQHCARAYPEGYWRYSRSPFRQASSDLTPDSFRQMSALGGAAILLVDDDEVVRNLCRRSLEGEGARVAQAGDGAAALSLIQEGDRQLDLVITDLRMPRINGRELAEVLSIFRPTLPVLGMTGGPAEADRRLPTLVKPFIADLVKEAGRLMRTRAKEQRSWAEERRGRAREARQLAAEMMDRQSALQQRVNLVAVALKLKGVAPDSH